jgi:hypothetical protein
MDVLPLVISVVLTLVFLVFVAWVRVSKRRRVPIGIGPKDLPPATTSSGPLLVSIVFLVCGFVLTGIALALYGVDGATAVWALFGPFTGAIGGYWFGSKYPSTSK